MHWCDLDIYSMFCTTNLYNIWNTAVGLSMAWFGLLCYIKKFHESSFHVDYYVTISEASTTSTQHKKHILCNILLVECKAKIVMSVVFNFPWNGYTIRRPQITRISNVTLQYQSPTDKGSEIMYIHQNTSILHTYVYLLRLNE